MRTIGFQSSQDEHEVPVVVIGAGPVGLATALGLANHGVRSVLVEKKSSTSEHSKAPGIHARTMEVFRQWGVVDSIAKEAIGLERVTPYAARTDTPVLTLDIGELRDECRYPGLYVLEQGRTEQILLDAVLDTGLCDVRFEHELQHFEQTREGVQAVVRSPEGEYVLATPYLVGCDGAGSRVREELGLSFDGITYPVDAVLADVRLGDERAELPFPRFASEGKRVMFAIRLESGSWRLVSADQAFEEEVDSDAPVDPELLRVLVRVLWGEGSFDVVWSSRFRLHRRCAQRFRVGRVLIAGDAAHVNSPVGAQGMNSGIHDAHNLAWKLASVLQGGDEELLLESYDAERRDLVGREVNRITHLMTRAALAPAPLQAAAVGVAKALARSKRLRRTIMRRATMLSQSYKRSPLFAGDTRSVGMRVPDVMLHRDGNACRLHDLIGLEPVLLLLGDQRHHPPAENVMTTVVVGPGGWRDPSGLLESRFGRQPAHLIRPDHFVGWSGVPPLPPATTSAYGSTTAPCALD